MNWDQDQDGNAIYAHNLKRRIETNRTASNHEMLARSNVSAVTSVLNGLIQRFEKGEMVDPKQFEMLGVQLSANVRIANEAREQQIVIVRLAS